MSIGFLTIIGVVALICLIAYLCIQEYKYDKETEEYIDWLEDELVCRILKERKFDKIKNYSDEL